MAGKRWLSRTRWYPRLRHRVGRRGFVLLSLAWVDIVYGWGLAFPSAERANSPTRIYMADVIPLNSTQESMWIWAMLWWTTAAFCLVNAFRQCDRWGFGAATALKVAWAAASVVAAMNGLEDGYIRATVWLWAAAVVFAISTWPEQSPSMAELEARADRAEEGGGSA